MDLTLTLTETPDAGLRAALGEKLAAFNTADVGPTDRRELVIFAQDADGALRAGLSGYTAWGWLYTQWLWMDETQRGQGLAGRLLAMAEAEARSRGCHGAYIDTFSPHGLKAYLRAGYTVFGELPDFPVGRTRSFLRKAL
ncbi:acetyltransferase protein [Ketogulonicigenium robustum]|uniref:Acetyltransferase protein n=1 Tax=Ketogulonicigenium robustum TaxID=92947 RepID=A0A1W6NXC6_9RHOB|nr:GNAT family N-acetyltransferase [Ketogulonicigenium robustum]ARO13884.1 acetyltransferase protein [Ketogulonicigenium robustum]